MKYVQKGEMWVTKTRSLRDGCFIVVSDPFVSPITGERTICFSANEGIEPLSVTSLRARWHAAGWELL